MNHYKTNTKPPDKSKTSEISTFFKVWTITALVAIVLPILVHYFTKAIFIAMMAVVYLIIITAVAGFFYSIYRTK